MHPTRRILPGLLVVACLLLPPCLTALINPNFTIVDLYNGSETVLVLELGPVAEGRITAKVTETVKGQSPGDGLTFVLSKDEQAVEAAGWLEQAGAGRTAVLFLGIDGDPEVAAVEIGCTWVKCVLDPDGSWFMEDDDRDLQTVWAGSARTLAAAVRYVRDDLRPEFPVAEQVNWADERRLGQVAGPVHGILVIDLGNGAGACLLVLSPGGDRAFRVGGDQAGADITEALGLEGGSQHLAAMDVTGDGRTDLVSWDGQALALRIQGDDGRFGAPVPGPALAGVASLAALRLPDGQPGLAAGTADGVVLLAVERDGKIEILPPPPSSPGLPDLGTPGPCLVADVNDDGFADLVSLHDEGLLVHAGQAEAPGFGPPVATVIDLPAGIRSVVPGDYDGDGRLDLFVLGGKGFVLLRRGGDGGWIAATFETGELLVTRPKNDDPASLAAAAPLDLNGDGRQGIALFNGQAPPSMLFNRGFACFGLSRKMGDTYKDDPAFAGMGAGVQAGTVADLDGDGFPDALVVDPEGGVWGVRTSADRPRRFRLTLALPADASGPRTVTVDQGDRPLGTYLVRPAMPVTLGLPKAGPTTLRWRGPDGTELVRKVIVTRPTEAVLAPQL